MASQPKVLFDSRQVNGFQQKKMRPFILFGAIVVGAIVVYLVLVFGLGLYETQNSWLFMFLILGIFAVIIAITGYFTLKDVKEFSNGVIVHSDGIEANGKMVLFKDVESLDWTFSRDTAMLKWLEEGETKKYEFFKDYVMDPQGFIDAVSGKLKDRLKLE